MKQLVLVIVAVVCTLSSQGAFAENADFNLGQILEEGLNIDFGRREGRFNDDGYPTPQNVICGVYDRGHEEHSPHYSCRECLREHGRCVEICQEVYFTCKVQGRDARNGMTNFHEATGENQWETEDRALERCYRSGDRNCRLIGCNQQSQPISRRECRGRR